MLQHRLVACMVIAEPFFNQSWVYINWVPGYKYHLKYDKISTTFTKENKFENIVCKIVASLLDLIKSKLCTSTNDLMTAT